MRLARQTQYTPLTLRLHPAQLEALADLANDTGRDRTALIREAIALLVGRYALAKKERDDAKMA